LMVNYEFPPIGGGAGHAHRCILKEYAGRDDLTVDVLTCAAKPGFHTEKFADNITIYHVGLHKKHLHYWRKIEVIEWLLKASRHYRRLLRNNNYDLAHAFFAFPSGWLCYRTAEELPYIISLRGSDVPGYNARLKLDYKLLGPVFKAIWKRAGLLVACSRGLKNRALRFLPETPVQVVPNGVNLRRFRPSQTRGLGSIPHLLTVGRLSPTKRVEMLIEAVRLLHSENRKVQLTIVGEGARESALRKLVKETHLEYFFIFKRRVDSSRMPELYRQADILVSATMQEGMSNAMLEAMACGLPIVTTKCEGVEELISDNGIVVQQAKPEAIVTALKTVINDEKLYDTMCVAARKNAQKFGWRRTAAEYRRYYNQIQTGKTLICLNNI